MRRIYQILLPSLFLFGAHTTAAAGQCAGVKMQDSVTLDGQTLVLNGLGLRLATFVKVKVYVAGLYVPKQSDQAQLLLSTDQPWQLVLSFMRSVDSGDMVKAWNEGFADNAKAQLPVLKDRIDTLNGVMKDLKEKDTLIFSYVPGKGTSIEVKGHNEATIEGHDFASALLSIWLGTPPNDEIKRGLLGGKCD
jgi:hypothetical protein